MSHATRTPTFGVFVLSMLLTPGMLLATSPVTLDNAGATVAVSETAVLVTKGDQAILRLEAFRFNYERVDTWEIGSHDGETITLRATVPPSVDFYRAATDTRARDLEIPFERNTPVDVEIELGRVLQ